jgi:hypothetical protein
VRAEKAIEALSDLKIEAEGQPVMSGGGHFTAWKAKIRGVLVSVLGNDDHLIERFDKVRYSLGMFTERTPASAFDDARRRGIYDACGIIDAAIYQLQLLTGDDEPVDERAFDPELWEFVKNLVEDEDWGKVASETAIFIENHVRTWANAT